MYARKNNVTAATADLNAVRQRAGLPALNTASVVLLDEIKAEQVRELFTEGQRVHELKRRRESIDPADRATSPAGADCAVGGCEPVPWNSRLTVFLIPQTFLDRNPLAVQND